MMEAHTNSSRDFRFARVPSAPQIHVLDRYSNIQPWDNNRVRLQVPAGHVDYINASPVALPSPAADGGPPDHYIAMQGPKRQSADHVWRMIVEQTQSPAVVVMLTETHEANVEKCFPYFPRDVDGPPFEVNERDEFGDGFRATITCEAIEETPAGEAIELRRLLIRVHKRRPSPPVGQTNGANGASAPMSTTGLRNGDAGEDDVDMKSPIAKTDDLDVAMKSPTAVRPQSLDDATATHPAHPEAAPVEYETEHAVYHFLYKKWPDFGVPALEDIASFFTLMRLSRARNADPANPRIVHCSAGVGRSGTFIALEHLTRALDAGTLSSLQHAPGTGLHAEWTGYHAGDDGDSDDEDADDVVFATVNALREQRRTMVQAEAQFLFIYRVLRKLWVDRYGEDKGDSPVGTGAGTNGAGDGGGTHTGEPAAKRQEVDPFVA